MNYKNLFKKENEAIRERYHLAMERIAEIERENHIKEPFSDYFHKTAAFVLMVKSIITKMKMDLSRP